MFISNFLGSKSVFTMSGTFISNSPLVLVLDGFFNGLITLAPFIGSFVVESTITPFTGINFNFFGGSGICGGVILPEGGILGIVTLGNSIPRMLRIDAISISNGLIFSSVIPNSSN